MTIQDIKTLLKSNQELLRGKVIQLGFTEYTSLREFGFALLEAEKKGLSISFNSVFENGARINKSISLTDIQEALNKPFTKLHIDAINSQAMLSALRNFGTTA